MSPKLNNDYQPLAVLLFLTSCYIVLSAFGLIGQVQVSDCPERLERDTYRIEFTADYFHLTGNLKDDTFVCIVSSDGEQCNVAIPRGIQEVFQSSQISNPDFAMYRVYRMNGEVIAHGAISKDYYAPKKE